MRINVTKIFSSIGARLAAVVLLTGVIAFGIIGSLTVVRLDLGLQEQADVLGQLSEQQLAQRLDGEVLLARARIEALGVDTARYLRQIAQRNDIAKAVATRNDVTIREPLLAQLAETLGIDRVIAFDEEGVVIGANVPIDLVTVQVVIRATDLAAKLKDILRDNRRSQPRGYEATNELGPAILEKLGMPSRLTIAHAAIEPVFDDFGEIIGALIGLRVLAPTESTLESFSSLSNAGVVIMKAGKIVSSAGPQGVSFSPLATNGTLVRSDDGLHVARCVDYHADLKVCTFTDAAVVTATRNQMFRIGSGQTRSLMWQFLIFAAFAMIMLVCALLYSVRHSTRGLSQLASTATAVADGDLDVPFRAAGVGEVHSLGIAFETMLANLRASMGQVRQLAFYDRVTGLPNREKIRIDSPEFIGGSKTGALAFIDLDGFKSINDTFGHKCGDLLLAKVAERLTKICAAYSSRNAENPIQLARVGGDEFAIIFPKLVCPNEITKIVQHLIKSLRHPFEVSGSYLTVGASIGVTLFPADGDNYDELLMNADLAMYTAKRKGRNTFAFFTTDMAERAKERHDIETDLRKAIRGGELMVHYQPQISCSDGRIRGVEALVRWNHHRLGWVSPRKFLDVAEEAGLIADIDRFVLERSIKDIQQLGDAGSQLVVAVNISALEIEDSQFAESIISYIRKARFPPSRLELEITESTAIRDSRIVTERIASLRKLGIRFAIDDFGIGYSNLSTLARLPIDTIKLDRSLISDVANNPENQTIVRITLNLARELNFETVAEGIETREDLKFVADAGATMAQGFLFSPAVPFEQLALIVQPGRLADIMADAAPTKRVFSIHSAVKVS